MDDVVAISGFATFVAIAIPPAGATTTTWVLIGLHTPIAITIAIILGLVGGNIAGMTKVCVCACVCVSRRAKVCVSRRVISIVCLLI